MFRSITRLSPGLSRNWRSFIARQNPICRTFSSLTYWCAYCDTPRGSLCEPCSETGPKRLPNSYMLYLKEARQADNSGLTGKALMSKLSEQYRNLPETEKAKLEATRAGYVAVYDDLLALYEPSEDADELKRQKQELKKKKKEKKKARSDKPKRLSGYNVFMRESFKKLKIRFPEMAMTELAKEVSAEWKAMGDSEKEEFKQKAAQLSQD